jgi:hypothetical protein
VSSASASETKRRSKKRRRMGGRRRRNKGKKAVADKNPVNVTANLFSAMQNEVKLSKFTQVKYMRTSRNSTKASDWADPERDLPIRKRTRLRCGNSL